MRSVHPSPHGLKDELAKACRVVGVRWKVNDGFRIEIPESRRRQPAGRDGESLARQNGMNILEERFPEVLVRKTISDEVVGDQIPVWLAWHVRMRENCFDLRPKHERLAIGPVVQRPASDGIARQDQLATI